MIPEIGLFTLGVALVVSLLLATLPMAGTMYRISNWIVFARPGANLLFILIAISYVCLSLSFLGDDFSVAYVANHSNTRLPLLYKISGVWGGHEGSMLLWLLILAGWTAAVSVFSRSIPEDMVARVLAVLGLVTAGFLLFVLFTSNPFERMFPVPPEGRDLNPLLQDPGLAIHPPMLYMGYVGFSVAFAFAVAALISGRYDAAWARWSRPWTSIAWMFLTIGIALGSWWAYYELGWGGWWFWDPVENASFMPWLVGTALIHSLAATEKRGVFKAWTLLLAVFAFSLSLLGTFLVRSGVLVSVHAFATDPTRGVFILAYLAVVVGGALLLYAFRASSLQSHARFEPVSRDMAILLNNVFFTVLCFVVLLGTLYPLAADSLGLGKLSVGPPYFDFLFAVIGFPLAFLLGTGALLRWKRDKISRISKTLGACLVLSVATGLLFPALMSHYETGAVLGVVAGSFAVYAGIAGVIARTRSDNRLSGIMSAPRWFFGMTIAHIGVGVFIIGVVVTNVYSVEKDVRLAPGEQYRIHDYSFDFRGIEGGRGPNYRRVRGIFDVYDDGDFVTNLHPEKRTYLVQTNPMTEAAIDPGLFRDIYVALGEPMPDGHSWTVRVYYKPYIRWIWLGALMMAFGGLVGAMDPRYRKTRVTESTTEIAATA